ncbi:MAG: vitamin K epoxide reductase family protein [Candidatus Pacearchaeota archaeon]|jgi:uncharacterized membrane protein
MAQYLLALILSVIGFALAYHIWNKKASKEKLVCIIGEDCSKVVESKYGKTFGIDNTVLGMLYYFFVMVAALVTLFLPMFLTIPLFVKGFLAIAGLSALFSLYLTFVQVVFLKEFCEYCLGNTLITILIFVMLVL